MTTPNEAPLTADELDEASLDLVVGCGVMVPDAGGDRKHENNEKLGQLP